MRPAAWAQDVEKGELICDETKSGTITSPGETHIWTFTANKGDRVILHVLATGGDLFYPYVRVLTPDLTETVVEHTSKNNVLEFTAEESGRYAVLVRDYDIANSGTYNIRLAGLVNSMGSCTSPDDPDGGLLVCDVTSTGSISPCDLDVFWFTANKGDRVILHVLATGGDLFYPYVRVLTPDLTETVVEHTSKNNVLEFTAEESGRYAVLVRDYDIANSGTYNIRLAGLVNSMGSCTSPDDPDGGLLVCDVTSTGSISPCDLDVFWFTANKGDRVILHVLATGGDLFYPYVRVLTPDLTETVVEHTSKNNMLEFTAEESGRYSVLVRDYDIANTGTYDVLAGLSAET